ncbi:MAG: aldehyde dehydrogenase family protein [Candidatus Aminicenantes bacterium]|nr:aldehyde dehydrogenase family protein [Candidatus Aminicenantes bacterium]
MKILLNGEWVDRGDKLEVRDPFDDSLVDVVPRASQSDVSLAFNAAAQGFKEGKRMTVFDRARILNKTAAIVSDNLEIFAVLIAREASKTIREARKEVSRCVNTLTVSAEESKRILGETIPFDSFPGGEQRKGYYYRFPIGVILAITPFNDPLNLVAHKLGPALAAGNSVVLKPATVTPLSALKLAEAFLEAGLPPKMLQVIIGIGSEIGDSLVTNDIPRMISFTGGVEAGKRIASLAGIKKMGMELGSDSPVIVWNDADIDWAVESCVSGAFWAAGQNCIGVQRLYIHKKIYKIFRDKFVARTDKYKIGDKLREDTDMGPMITEGEAHRVELWIQEAVKKGAAVLTGGKRTKALVEPTVLENVPEEARLHAEEVFGPTVNLYPIEDLDEALEKANSLPFGLHAAIFTQDVNVAFKAVYGLDCGGVMINDSTDYRLDSMPFGGVKYSGLGREGIKFALQEMTEPKVICFYLPEI